MLQNVKKYIIVRSLISVIPGKIQRIFRNYELLYETVEVSYNNRAIAYYSNIFYILIYYNMKYYLIHGVDKSRGPRMLNEFMQANIPENDVTFILSHNKDVLTDEFIQSVIMHNESNTCGIYVPPGCRNLRKGQISCTYKHYLALKDIVENGYEYAVIMEDNIFFKGDVSKRIETYISQLNEYYPDWDIIFDSDWTSYTENQTTQDILVYAKSNDINKFGHGGTRCAHFYLLTKKCAKKLYDNYLPFNNAPDWWMNDLFRKLDIKSHWAEPSIVGLFPHVSTAN